MAEKSAQCRRRRRRGWRHSDAVRRGEAAGEQADGGAFDIALDAGDLSGKAQARHRLEAQRAVEEPRAVDEGVAMEAAEPCELGLLEAGDHAEDALLLGMLQLRLEADHVVERA